METFSISVPEKKSSLVKQLLQELGVIINTDTEKKPNKTTIASIKKTSKGEELTKSSSHLDLMQKLNS
ncbi:hypothetical protein [Pedobacter alluvionis]|uniref:Uncharacterized protein n=1 Tax=Pedobacter alluvionis TaxID=475253 RepID=A0A497XYV0_9SPHI|nr:hypothetical protein [Pedobacter alluvionis]RLJ72685.1 hypothetical protein BCL90_4322 [Pedobacter alluvionis]TFB29470.1 hypothetical protein E3V97_20760 [Pedobacter alluvionis]